MMHEHPSRSLSERAPREQPSLDWHRAHEGLSRLARSRARLDWEEGRLLLDALRSNAHLHLGFGSFGEYIERLLGHTRRATEERLRVAEALELSSRQSVARMRRSLESWWKHSYLEYLSRNRLRCALRCSDFGGRLSHMMTTAGPRIPAIAVTVGLPINQPIQTPGAQNAAATMSTTTIATPTRSANVALLTTGTISSSSGSGAL